MTDTQARSSSTGRESRLPPAQSVAMVAAVVFALVGILGFIPGATTHFDFQTGQRFSGPGSTAMLFGVFQTSVLHNGIFLAFGIVGAVSGFFALTARLFFFLAAVIFLFLGVYGLAIDQQSAANFLPMNTADNILHLAIGVVVLAIGATLSLARSS